MIEAVDFNHSFVTWHIAERDLYGRFMIESVYRVWSDENPEVKTFCLLSGVLACKVLEGEQMLHQPSYLFQAVFSGDEFRIFRIDNRNGNTKDNHGANSFNKLDIHLVNANARTLNTPDEVCTSVLANKPIVAKINLESYEGVHCTLEFPVKHVNAQLTNTSWQVETGQVLLPDCLPDLTMDVRKLTPAYVAFNNQQQFNYSLLETEKMHRDQTRFYHRAQSIQTALQIQLLEHI